MAFCTSCGAQVNGAFCVQCGTPAKSAGAQASASGPAPQPAQPASGYSPGAAPAAVASKTSPIVWILVAVAGIFVLGIVGVVGTTFFVAHKIKQAGFDTELMSRNPGMAIAKMVTTFNPDVEVVKTDESAGTITVRDKKSGKVVTMNFDDIKNGGRIRFSAQDDDGKTASMEIGGDSKLPSWVPAYPGATAKPQMTIKGDDSKGAGEAGNVTFSTSDSAAKVTQFYQDKMKELGLKVNLTTNSNEGGMMVAADEDNKRTLTVIITPGGSDGTGVNLIYSTKK